MITERRFAHEYQSFWNVATPMASAYIRRENLALERFAEPLPMSPSANRGVTNELGFRLFAEARSQGVAVRTLGGPASDHAAAAAVDFIRRFREFSRTPVEGPSAEAAAEALVLAERLEGFVAGRKPRSVSLLPGFAGCGWIDECNGDLLLDEVLCEVKASEDRFRSRDLRQLLVYAALNQQAARYVISELCLVNPRLGVFLRVDLDSVCLAVSGAPAAQVLGEIVAFVSEPNRLGELG